jgi:hypothetical protein
MTPHDAVTPNAGGNAGSATSTGPRVIKIDI